MTSPSPRPTPTVELPTPPVDGATVAPRRSRRSRYVSAGLVLLLLGIAAASYWVVSNRAARVVVTDARVAATMVAVSARTRGWLVSIPVEEGQHIQRDVIVAVIDQRESKLALAEAEAQLDGLNAELAKIGSQRELSAATLKSHLAKARSEYAAAESINRAAGANLERARIEWDRATPLFEREIISREFWEEKRSAYEKAEQAVQVSAAGVVTAAAAIDEATANQKQLAVIDGEIAHMRQVITEATAHRDRLAVALSDREIRTPTKGVIDDIFVDAGEYVTEGQHLMVIHDPSDIWVLANVKETDIRHVAAGATAKITVDAYPDREITGVIRRIGNAATSQIAPPPNRDPNKDFTKVTQRIEVRIDVAQDAEMLKPGMMVEVEIDF
jgi:membrane fusion protein (multidrug efflux system)